jgi:hypothetical protein
MLVLKNTCNIIHRMKGEDHGSEKGTQEDFEEGCEER